MKPSPNRCAFVTPSGSGGKSTSAVNIAAELGQRGLRVLLTDLDWQMDATQWLTDINETTLGDQLTTLDVLRTRTSITDAIVKANVDGVWVVPASPDLKDVNKLLGSQKGVLNQLRRALDLVEHNFDVILIDCRAGTELATEAGMIAADYVIGCLQPGMKEMRNAISLDELVEEIADGHDRPLKLIGILPCNVPAAGGVYKEVLELIETQFEGLLLPSVRHSAHVTEAHAQRLPLIARKRWANVAGDYAAVVDELTARQVFPKAKAKAKARRKATVA